MFPPNSENTWMLMRSISEADRNQKCLFPRCVSARLLLVCASSPRFTEHDVPPSVPAFIFHFLVYLFASRLDRPAPALLLWWASTQQESWSRYRCCSPTVKLSELLSMMLTILGRESVVFLLGAFVHCVVWHLSGLVNECAVALTSAPAVLCLLTSVVVFVLMSCHFQQLVSYV